MIFDATNLFSDKQVLTESAVSTNTIDLGAVGTPINANGPLRRDLGAGAAVCIVTQVVADFVGATSVEAILEVSDTDDFVEAKTVATSGVTLVADLVAGKQLAPQYIPQGTDQRYVRMRYEVDGTATAGAITSGITCGHQTN